MTDLEKQSAAEQSAHEEALAGVDPTRPVEEPVVETPVVPPVVMVRGLIRNTPRVAPAAR